MKRPLVSAFDAAKFLGISKKSLYTLLDSGKIAAKRIGAGQRWRIHAFALEAYKANIDNEGGKA